MKKLKIKIPVYAILSIFLLNLIACSSPKKLTEAGRYNDAVSKAVHKLSGKRKKKAKHVEALEIAFQRATANDLEKMAFLKSANDSRNWDQIYGITQKIKRRQNLVEPLLPLIDDRGYEAYFNFVKVRGLEQEAKVKAAEHHYAEAKLKLDNARTGNRLAARAAYDNLQQVDRYFARYKEKDNLEREALDLGKTRVLFKMHNQSRVYLPAGFEREILRVGIEDMNSRWNEFHLKPQLGLEYDYEVKMNLMDIEVSPEYVREREYIDRKEIEDGFEYVLDDRGNVVKDSLGNDVKVPATRIIEAVIFESFQNKYAKVAGQLQIIDTRTGAFIRREPIAVNVDFENYASTFRGDRRALSSDSRNRIGNQPLPFPSDENMLLDAADLLKPVVKNKIRKREFI